MGLSVYQAFTLAFCLGFVAALVFTTPRLIQARRDLEVYRRWASDKYEWDSPEFTPVTRRAALGNRLRLAKEIAQAKTHVCDESCAGLMPIPKQRTRQRGPVTDPVPGDLDGWG
jgi:hypothetical protein